MTGARIILTLITVACSHVFATEIVSNKLISSVVNRATHVPTAQKPKAPASIEAVKPVTDIKTELESTALKYFIDHAHPTTGLVRDFADNFKPTPATNNVASMAATGFGLAVIANASTRGMVDSTVAYNYCLKTLKFSRDKVSRRKGWFLHWVNWETGARTWQSEYSTIDTALFIAGALYAAKIFPNTEVAQITYQLYDEMDYQDALTDGGAQPQKKTLSMGYFNESGYTAAQWNMYAEQMILLLLGMGHRKNPLPGEVWLTWARKADPLPNFPQELMGADQALFVHQYSQLFVDFRGFKDRFKNYHDNAVEMTKYHRQLLKGEEVKYKTLREGFWGYSAGQAPNNKYHVYSALYHGSTVCVGCTLGSTMYLPGDILNDAKTWRTGKFASQIWGTYGFVDSLDIDENWFSTEVLGITVGPIFLSLANLNEQTSVWKTFMSIPEITVAIERASAAEHAPPPVILTNALAEANREPAQDESYIEPLWIFNTPLRFERAVLSDIH